MFVQVDAEYVRQLAVKVVYFGTQNAVCDTGVEFTLSSVSLSVVLVPNAYAHGSATRQSVKYVITTNKIQMIKVCGVLARDYFVQYHFADDLCVLFLLLDGENTGITVRRNMDLDAVTVTAALKDIRRVPFYEPRSREERHR
jgi:hypothetical protein